jgi:hypothetical protein
LQRLHLLSFSSTGSEHLLSEAIWHSALQPFPEISMSLPVRRIILSAEVLLNRQFIMHPMHSADLGSGANLQFRQEMIRASPVLQC